MPKRLIFLFLIVTSCQSQGKLQFMGDLSNSLKEVSALELYNDPNRLWVIEDSGNTNKIYVLDSTAAIRTSITVNDAKNRDWEDLTFDSNGNLYIGDFGNNEKKNITYTIYKVNKDSLSNRDVSAQKIEFTLPKKHKPKDFEAFFVYKDIFYIFSKESKEFNIYSVPNKMGMHEASFYASYNLPGKKNKITSADISEDGQTIVLLNHDKLWRLTDFGDDDFFSGRVEGLEFNHESQKEGICFKTKTSILLTDERNGAEGGNLYKFDLTLNGKHTKN